MAHGCIVCPKCGTPCPLCGRCKCFNDAPRFDHRIGWYRPVDPPETFELTEQYMLSTGSL